MTQIVSLSVEKRTSVGTGAARALRREGKIPGVVYGGNEPSESIALSLKQFNQQYQKGSFQTKLIELDFGKNKITVLPKKVDLHVVTDIPQHVDFIRISKDTTVRIAVNIKVINEDKSLGIKRGGVLNLVHRTIDLLCHPEKIPAYIEVDIGSLDIGHNLHMSAIKLPEGISPADSSDFTVISITGRSAEEEKASGAGVDSTAATPAAGGASSTGTAAASGANAAQKKK